MRQGNTHDFRRTTKIEFLRRRGIDASKIRLRGTSLGEIIKLDEERDSIACICQRTPYRGKLGKIGFRHVSAKLVQRPRATLCWRQFISLPKQQFDDHRRIYTRSSDHNQENTAAISFVVRENAQLRQRTEVRYSRRKKKVIVKGSRPKYICKTEIQRGLYDELTHVRVQKKSISCINLRCENSYTY